MLKLFPQDDRQGADHVTLAGDQKICRYLFTVLWNRGAICNLFMLNGQTDGGIWQQVITTTIADSDGEITVEIGHLVKGSTLNLMFGVQAIVAIDSIRIIITNATENTPARVRPKKDLEIKKMAKGEIYTENIEKYVLQ